MENCILVDWFAMTFREPDITVYDVIRALGLREDINFIEMPGRYYYRNRLTFGNIHIYYNHAVAEQNFPMLELTGQGCREFETFSSYNFDYLFELAKDTKKYHMSRLDIAYDDHEGLLNIKEIMLDGFNNNYVSNSNIVSLHDEKRHHLDGFSLITGSKSSDMYMRIYDKARERGFTDGRHWIRCELVLKQDRATNFIMNEEPLGVKYRGVIHNYFRFVSPNKKDLNKRRWKTRRYWRKFLDGVEKISVYSKKEIDYNISRLHRYVVHQSGNSVDTYIRCVGLNAFFEKLLKRDTKLTPRQKLLIEQCNLLYEQGEEITEETILKLSQIYKL